MGEEGVKVGDDERQEVGVHLGLGHGGRREVGVELEGSVCISRSTKEQAIATVAPATVIPDVDG